MKEFNKMITTFMCIMIINNSIQASTNNQNTNLIFKTLKALTSYEDVVHFSSNSGLDINNLTSIKANSKLDFKTKLPEFKISNDFIEFKIQNNNFKLKTDNMNNVMLMVDSETLTFNFDESTEAIINKINMKFSKIGFNWVDLIISRANAQLFEAISVLVACVAIIVILAISVTNASEKKKQAFDKLKENLVKTKSSCTKLKLEQEENSNFQIPKTTYENYNLLNEQYVNLCVLEYQNLLLLQKNGVYSNPELIKDFKYNCSLFTEAKKCILGIINSQAIVDSSKRTSSKENQYHFDKTKQYFILSK